MKTFFITFGICFSFCIFATSSQTEKRLHFSFEFRNHYPSLQEQIQQMDKFLGNYDGLVTPIPIYFSSGEFDYSASPGHLKVTLQPALSQYVQQDEIMHVLLLARKYSYMQQTGIEDDNIEIEDWLRGSLLYLFEVRKESSKHRFKAVGSLARIDHIPDLNALVSAPIPVEDSVVYSLWAEASAVYFTIFAEFRSDFLFEILKQGPNVKIEDFLIKTGYSSKKNIKEQLKSDFVTVSYPPPQPLNFDETYDELVEAQRIITKDPNNPYNGQFLGVVMNLNLDFKVTDLNIVEMRNRLLKIKTRAPYMTHDLIERHYACYNTINLSKRGHYKFLASIQRVNLDSLLEKKKWERIDYEMREIENLLQDQLISLTPVVRILNERRYTSHWDLQVSKKLDKIEAKNLSVSPQ